MSVYYNDIDPYCAQWLRNLIAAGHLPAGEVDERPIQSVAADDVRQFRECHFFAGIGGWPLAIRLAGIEDRAGIWTGSCPCQPFSEAGKRLGLADDRHLWPAFASLICECQPTTIFGEQVASKSGRTWLALVLDDLEEMGYWVGGADLCAAGIGAPQIRQRLWWMANAHHEGREGGIWERQSNQAWQEWKATRSESLRSDRGPWPPGPGDIDKIPQLANGLPGVMGACKAYGNAIVPQVAQVFIESVMECMP